jgi:hypothetical protein
MHSLNEVCEFNGFRLFWGFGQLTSEMRAELVQFWIANGAITDSFEAWRRTSEVGCVVLNKEGKIVGVNSIYIDRLIADGRSYWFYRTFIRPDCRVMGLTPRIFNVTFDNLSNLSAGKLGAPSGIVFVTENPKLESRAGSRIFQRNGVEPLGINQQGKSVWRKCFPAIVS